MAEKRDESQGPGDVPSQQQAGKSKNCLVTVSLLQANYVNNSQTSELSANFHVNIEGRDLYTPRIVRKSGTIGLPSWYREIRRNRCGTDVEISFVVDVALSPIDGISQLEAHVDETRTYKCPSHKDHEVFKLTVGDPKKSNIAFDFVFRITLECVDENP